MMNAFQIGQGFDVHRFAEPEAQRPLILMGVHVEHDRGLLGHSDADVMVHALMDALLGAAGLGDIGMHFPDTQATYKGANSVGLLDQVVTLIHKEGWRVVNADITLVGERPKLGPYRVKMHETIAPHLHISEAKALNIKATTTEKLGFTGRQEGLAAQAIVLLEKTSS